MNKAEKKYELMKQYEARAQRSCDRFQAVCSTLDGKIPSDKLEPVKQIGYDMKGVHLYICDVLAAMEELMKDPNIDDVYIHDFGKINETLDIAELILPTLERRSTEIIEQGLFDGDIINRHSFN